MKCTASFLIALAVTGCSTNRSAPQADVDSPKIIYAVSQSEAFAMAQQALVSAPRGYSLGEYQIDSIHDGDAIHDRLIGYRLVYRGWSPFHSFTQNLYVIPVAGVRAGGQEISGFRFLITAAGPKVGYAFVRASAQDRSLVKTLNAALDSTGTTVSVTNLRLRPYDETAATQNSLRRNP
jgi:hypothetical protein